MRKRYYAARFACWELHLFLDTHPNNKELPAAWRNTREGLRACGKSTRRNSAPWARPPRIPAAGPGSVTPGPGKRRETECLSMRSASSIPSTLRTPTALGQIDHQPVWRPHGEIGASLRYLSQRYAMPIPELKAILTDIGTEELSHLEMVGTIVYQLTRNMTPDQIKAAGLR